MFHVIGPRNRCHTNKEYVGRMTEILQIVEDAWLSRSNSPMLSLTAVVRREFQSTIHSDIQHFFHPKWANVTASIAMEKYVTHVPFQRSDVDGTYYLLLAGSLFLVPS